MSFHPTTVKIMKLLLISLLLISCTGCSAYCYFKHLENVHDLESGEYNFYLGFYKKAMRDLLPAAKNDNVRAQYAVGYMYYYGYGVLQDTEKGYYWISKAALAGNVNAINALRIIKASASAAASPKPKMRTYTDYLNNK
jgi:TPR repeat protein